jgi:hypothetical protein
LDARAESMISNILKKYNIDDNGSVLVCQDIKFEDPYNDPVRRAINVELEKKPISAKKYSDLNLVLDYINR